MAVFFNCHYAFLRYMQIVLAAHVAGLSNQDWVKAQPT